MSRPVQPVQRVRAPLLLVTATLLALAGCGGQAPEGPTARPTAGTGAPASVAGAVLAPPDCPTTAEPFVPTRVTVPGVGRDLEVVTPPRASATVPGTPSTDARGARQVAFDTAQGVEPGDVAGNVLLNAHTFPGGRDAALGNQLLADLQVGGRVVLADADQRLCYRVTERVEVDATQPFPRYYATDGPPQVAIVVCSGERLGPGVWTERTVWFASPAA